MSISNLFENNDALIKCKSINVNGNLLNDGDLIDNGNLTTDGFFKVQKKLFVFGNNEGGNYNILTSTGSGTQPAWRENINGFHLSSGSSTLSGNEFIGQGYINANNNFTNFVVSQPLTIRCFACRVVNAPGIGNSFVFELYKNGIATGFQSTIADLNTTSSSSIFNLAYNQYDVFSMHVILLGLPPLTTCSVVIDYSFNF